MRKKFSTTVFFLFVVLMAFSKESITVVGTDPIVSNNTPASFFNSGWESVKGWTTQSVGNTLIFQYSRTVPELDNSALKNGVVVVFARNLWADVPAFVELGTPDKPVKMPFYFLPDFDKPEYSELWSYSANENKINLILEIKGATTPWKPGNQVQFRYLVIPDELLKAKGLTIAAARRMAYNDIIQTFGIL